MRRQVLGGEAENIGVEAGRGGYIRNLGDEGADGLYHEKGYITGTGRSPSDMLWVMERGFDRLMTPEGIALVTAAMLFLLTFIVMGGVWAKLSARAAKEEKNKKKHE